MDSKPFARRYLTEDDFLQVYDQEEQKQKQKQQQQKPQQQKQHQVPTKQKQQQEPKQNAVPMEHVRLRKFKPLKPRQQKPPLMLVQEGTLQKVLEFDEWREKMYRWYIFLDIASEAPYIPV
jgi:hypothetical protein